MHGLNELSTHGAHVPSRLCCCHTLTAEACKVKDAALPTVAKKLTVPLLRAALEVRGKPMDGLKAALVTRLLEALRG